MTVRSVFFDLDGTLIDSLDDLTDAVNFMLTGMGHCELSVCDTRPLLGKGARNLVQRALATTDSIKIEHGLKLFLEFNRANIAVKSKLYPGTKEMLESLASHNISLAAISNKNEELSRLILKDLGISSFFEFICGGDTFEEMKPSPVPLLKTAEQLAIPTNVILMVGDSSNDIQAGIRAGIATIGCCWGYGDQDELRQADYLVYSCNEIPCILQHQEEKCHGPKV